MTQSFDYAHATPDEIRAEADRRTRERIRAATPKRTPPKRDDRPTLSVPVELFIPWGYLVRDNAKYAPAKRANGRLALILTNGYRAAKAEMGKLATFAMRDRVPFEGPVLLRATMHEPDDSRTRDPVNYAKAVHDSLNKIVYRDDSQITVAWWIRGTVDAQRPGLEVLVAPLTTGNTEWYVPSSQGGA